MYITNEHIQHIEILNFYGVVNAENVSTFQEHIEKIVNDDTRLVILNLEKLEEIDSTGIGCIISLLKRMRMKNGDVRILKIRGAVKKLFELLRIDRGIDLFESLDMAMKD